MIIIENELIIGDPEKSWPEKTINLQHPEGNAFFLLGIVENSLKTLGYTKKESDEILKDMMSDTYENLIALFEYHLGNHFKIISNQENFKTQDLIKAYQKYCQKIKEAQDSMTEEEEELLCQRFFAKISKTL